MTRGAQVSRSGGRWLSLPATPAKSSGAGRELRSCRRVRRVPAPRSPAVLCPQAGGDGRGHEQHAAESGGAGAHGRGPAHRRAAPVSGAFLPLRRGRVPGLSSSPGDGERGSFGGRRARVPADFVCTGAPALLPSRPRAPAPRSAAMRTRGRSPGSRSSARGAPAAGTAAPCVEQESWGEAAASLKASNTAGNRRL